MVFDFLFSGMLQHPRRLTEAGQAGEEATVLASSSTRRTVGLLESRWMCSFPSQKSPRGLPNPSLYRFQFWPKEIKPVFRLWITVQPPPSVSMSQYTWESGKSRAISDNQARRVIYRDSEDQRRFRTGCFQHTFKPPTYLPTSLARRAKKNTLLGMGKAPKSCTAFWEKCKQQVKAT